MPHKHKRLKTVDEAQFNLPPTAPAKALPVKHNHQHDDSKTDRQINQQDGRAGVGTSAKAKAKKGRRSTKGKGYGDDDTPRAFAQLMQLRKTGRGYGNSLDDGRRPAAKQSAGPKRKRDADLLLPVDADPAPDGETNLTQTQPELKIQPGERLTDYAARVDNALPVSGLIAKHGNKVDGVSEQRKTKHEKKLQRLVNNWKAEEARRIEKVQEKWDEEEMDEDEDEVDHNVLWEGQSGGKGKKKVKRRGSDTEDPWAQLKAKRDKPRGVFDVAQAPPEFTRVPKEFKVRDGAKVNVGNVPNAGSLRRREMLNETRKDVIARYREIMQAKRGE